MRLESLNSRKTGSESVSCRPAIEGAHEKGGAEGQLGRFRHNHLVPTLL
ncbi:hypothetical protein [Kitasatospora sp. NPDC005856]